MKKEKFTKNRKSKAVGEGKIMGLLSDAVAFAGKATEKTENFLSKIASKKVTVPLFISLAFLGFWFSSYVAGYDIFEIDKMELRKFYHIYLCDYSVGFNSFLLVGAVVTKILGTVSIVQMSHIAMWAVIFAVAAMSVLAGLLIRRGLIDKIYSAVLLGILFALEPIISQTNFSAFGYYDIYVLLVFLLILPTYCTRIFFFAAPILSLVAMSVHYQYMFTFFPVILALLVYGIFMNEGKVRRKNIAALCVTSVSGGGLFLYITFFAKNFVRMSPDDFYELMVSRFSVNSYTERALQMQYDGKLFWRDYVDMYIFGNHNDISGTNGKGFIEFMTSERERITSPQLYIAYLKYCLPVILVFAVIWFACAYLEKGSRKLPYIANACIMLALVPELIISTDLSRWTASTLTAQLVLLCLLTLKGDKTLKRVLSFGTDAKGLASRFVCAGGLTAYLVWMLFYVKAVPIM